MRIGYLCHKYPLGDQIGAIFAHELARAMHTLGHEVHALVPRTDGQGGTLTVDGVQVHRRLSPLKLMHQLSVDDSYVKRPRPGMVRFLASGVVELFRLARGLKLDVIHAHWAIPMGLVATSSRMFHRLPVVITAHGRDLYLNAMDGVTRGPGWARPVTGLALRSADLVIFTTEDYASYAKEYGVAPDRWAVIPNGVDTDMFRPGLDGADLRSRAGARSDELVLLFVGSFDEKKGLFVLIQAMAQLVKLGTAVRLVMAGDGPLRAALERMIRELGLGDHVTMLGRVEHRALPAVYAGCDLYVQPSLVEPFGVVALEAAASGKAVVATDVLGLRTVVSADTGVLVPPGDAEALASTIHSLLRDESRRRELGRVGRRRAEERYSWHAVARRTVEYYRNVLSAKSRA